MTRFSVYRLRSGVVALDCQSDLLSHFKTRFVVPLLPENEVPPSINRLHPVFEIDGQRMAMATHLASALPLSEFSQKLCSLEAHEYEIGGALDVLIGGV